MNGFGFPPSLKQLIVWGWDPLASRRCSAQECVEKLEGLMIESSIRDQTGGAIWANVSEDELGCVKESVPFEVFFESYCKVLGVKKKQDSMSAILLKEIFSSMSGENGENVTLVDFGRVCGLLGPVDDAFLKRLKKLTKQKFFFAGLSTKASEKLLMDENEGVFLVRFSSSAANFSLSYVKGGKIWHTRIKHESAGNTYELDGTQQLFNSLSELIAVAIKSKFENISTPCSGSVFETLWKKKKNAVGGYK
jgi:hypothetical protein